MKENLVKIQLYDRMSEEHGDLYKALEQLPRNQRYGVIHGADNTGKFYFIEFPHLQPGKQLLIHRDHFFVIKENRNENQV